jgi:transcriptional regulator with XRE-family HTH domain
MRISTIGQRIYELRTDRVPKLTQHQLAERAGVSVDVIQKLEQGRKQSARITTLTRIATALDTDLPALVGKPTRLESPAQEGGLLELRRAITPVTGSPEVEPTGPQALADAWRLYWAGDYDTLCGLLPPLIYGGAGDGLAEALRMAACVLVQLGHADLAHTAVSRALETVEDASWHAAMVGTLAWVLLSQGRPGDAAVVAVRGADEAEPRLSRASAVEVSVWGNLLLAGATASARAGEPDRAHDLLRVAGAAAARLDGDRNDFETVFGPTHVTMQTVDVAVVAGDYPGALDAAGRMPVGSDLPVAARARHLTDVAHAHMRLGHRERAEELILRVARMAPRWIRYQAFPRTVVSELVGRRPASTGLRSLAGRLGVDRT